MAEVDINFNPNGPYRDNTTNRIYNLLFCDNIGLYVTNDIIDKYPWSTLFSKTADAESLQKIIDDPNGETRPKILAYNKLLLSGKKPSTAEVLGIIIEVHLEEGLDVLAAYKDGTARYINHSEKIIVWEAPNEKSTELIKNLFQKGEEVVKQIGPWDKERLPYPPPGEVRITFLVSDGLYFGQGEIDVLFNDEKGGPVLESATMLMQYITEAAGN